MGDDLHREVSPVLAFGRSPLRPMFCVDYSDMAIRQPHQGHKGRLMSSFPLGNAACTLDSWVQPFCDVVKGEPVDPRIERVLQVACRAFGSSPGARGEEARTPYPS